MESVWLTYAPTDFLLFSPRTYARLFELHNRAIWPAQLAAAAAGAAVLALLVRPRGAWSGRAVAGLLAAAWLWVAWAFLLRRYAAVNWAAGYAAAAFLLEALLLAWTGVARRRPAFRVEADAASRVGLALLLFALLVHPLLAPLAGRSWSGVELFGVAPDPTAAATLGLALTVPGRVPWALLAIPALWCVASGLTLWAMEAPEAAAPPLAAAAALLAAGWKSRRLSRGRRPPVAVGG